MRYRWALFDVGETLIRPRESFGAVYARVLAPLGLAREAPEWERALRTTWAEVSASLPPGTDRYGSLPGGEEAYWLRFVRRTLELAGTPTPGLAERALAPLRSAFAKPEAWKVFPEVEASLDRLRAAGIGLGVVSNWDSRLPVLLDRLGLAARFDVVVVSALAGVEKPHPEIFRRALEGLGADPTRTAHVGDIPELDGAGAHAAGIRPILLERHAPEGTDAVRDLRAAADLLLAS
ncbi:MAG TPA: HAD-IA family hydrolase [Candidatus Polarisedimenticolaceae bacterium]|nr:HAD-IA family hydrolase [Candidatus Polarisedimenticolaceae bacterium]